jgi:hypothetical protein
VSSGATATLYTNNKKVEAERIRKKEREKEIIMGRLLINHFRRCGKKRVRNKFVDKTLIFGSTD